MQPTPRTVLVITAAEDVTANLVIEALNARQVQVCRFDPADLGTKLTFHATIGDDRKGWAGRLLTPSRDIALEEVGAVYYRRPTSYLSRFAHLPAVEQQFAAVEAQHGLGGILHSLSGAVYVNHPAAIRRADYKPAQLQTATQLGLAIPCTLVTNDVEQARAFTEHGPIIYKSFRGVPPGPDGSRSAIWTQQVTPEELDESVSVTAHLFQQEIPKTADARVTVIGQQVFAYRITSPDGALDWRSGEWEQLTHEPIATPEPIRRALHAYLDQFGLMFGCFDFALNATGGRPETWTFVECNPNGQWAWLPDADAMAHAFADLILEGW
ncbi:ATP-grasp ribosomal peptide maturase [Streptosporangium amethystogenes subsp. fukuiense]|uniref:ATP-grasp ribosomal peptide maturase n=1 Tax=Streptosporangium amethystogenes subsp. fukuiense TaxID=698418 RepID=A0ABW2T513_9ACTN